MLITFFTAALQAAVLLAVFALVLGPLRAAHAASATGTFKIITYYQSSPTAKQRLSGVKVRIKPNYADASWGCNTAVKLTDSNGVAKFNCDTKTTDGGRKYDIKTLSKTGYTLITPIKSYYKLPASPTKTLEFNLTKDSDGDGVLDAYDKCPSTKGSPSYDGCKPPPNSTPKKCPSGYTGTPPSCKKKSSPKPSTPTSPPPTYSNTQSVAPPISPTSPQDTEPPSKPGDLSAAQVDPSSVALYWTASTDNKGVRSYSIQRSVDKKIWTTEEAGAEETSFYDYTISFDTLYYYRVFAVDEAGNTSNAATAEITTQVFEANARPDQESIIISEDDVVTAIIPAGAVNEPALCNIIPVEDFNDLLPISIEGPSLLYGPYALECKISTSEVIEEFLSDVTIELNFDGETVESAGLFSFDGEEWVDKEVQYSRGQPNFSFASRDSLPFAVLGQASSGGGGSAGVIIGIFISLLLLGGGVFAVRRYLAARSQQTSSGGSLFFDLGLPQQSSEAPSAEQTLELESHETASQLPPELTNQRLNQKKDDENLSPLQRAEKKLKEMQ